MSILVLPLPRGWVQVSIGKASQAEFQNGEERDGNGSGGLDESFALVDLEGVEGEEVVLLEGHFNRVREGDLKGFREERGGEQREEMRGGRKRRRGEEKEAMG